MATGSFSLLSSQLGILLHVLGSFLIVYGQTIVKVSHVIVETSKGGANVWRVSPLSPDGAGQLWRRPDGTARTLLFHAGSKLYAAVGWALFAVGNVLRFASMRFGSQTVLSGLTSIQFVVIPVASYQLLGVTSELSTYVGVGVVLVGNVLILLNGPPEVHFSPGQLRRQWGKADMRNFLFGIGFVMASMHVLWRLVHHRRRAAEARARAERQKELRRKRSLSRSGSFGNFDAGMDRDRTSLFSVPGSSEMELNWMSADEGHDRAAARDVRDPSTLRMFTAALLFSSVSAFVGAWSVLFAKSSTYIFGEMPEALFDWYTWVMVGAFLASAGFWVRQSDKGLRLYPATLIMPLMQAFWLGMSVLQGMIYFDEYEMLSSRALLYLLVGLVMAISGALMMGLSGWLNESRLLRTQSSPERGALGSTVGIGVSGMSGGVLPAGDDLEASANSYHAINSPALGSSVSLSEVLAEQRAKRVA